MKTIAQLNIILILLSLLSCEDNEAFIDISATNQDINVQIHYNGHIQTFNDVQHAVKVYLSNQSGTLFIKEISKNLQELKSEGAAVTFKNIEPGDYSVLATWDFNDDGAMGDEPKSINKAITVEGYDAESITLELIDQKNINEDGWVEGNIYYNGGENESHHIFVTVYGPDYFKSTKRITYYPVNLADIGTHGFLSNKLARGIYIAIEAFWDKNDNNQYDEGIDPHYLDLTSYFVNAGMGYKKNMTLTY